MFALVQQGPAPLTQDLVGQVDTLGAIPCVLSN